MYPGASLVHTLCMLGAPQYTSDGITSRNLDFVNAHVPLYENVRYVWCVYGGVHACVVEGINPNSLTPTHTSALHTGTHPTLTGIFKWHQQQCRAKHMAQYRILHTSRTSCAAARGRGNWWGMG